MCSTTGHTASLQQLTEAICNRWDRVGIPKDALVLSVCVLVKMLHSCCNVFFKMFLEPFLALDT